MESQETVLAEIRSVEMYLAERLIHWPLMVLRLISPYGHRPNTP